jgi:hypothetical protein
VSTTATGGQRRRQQQCIQGSRRDHRGSLPCRFFVLVRAARAPQSRYGASVAIWGGSVLPLGSIEYM